MSFICPSFFEGYCKPVFAYAERGTQIGLWAEPLNAVTNVAFVVAAVLLWRLQNKMQNQSVAFSSRLLAVLIGTIGIGSALFHTVANQWSQWADVLPILVFMLVYCWLAMTLFLNWGWVSKLAVIIVYLAITFTVEFFQGGPLADWLANYFDVNYQLAKTLAGGALYLPTILLLLGFSTLMTFRKVRVGFSLYFATLLFILSYAFRTLDGVTPNWTHGTHFFWHIFNATVLYMLVRILIIYAPQDDHH